MEKIKKEMKVGELVGKYPQFANVFDELKIDFCCGGGISLARAAEQKSVDTDFLLSRLESAIGDSASDLPDESWSAMELVEYIKRNHHRFVRSELPLLLKFLNKLTKVHGKNHPELIEIHRLFHTAAIDLKEHLRKEEEDVFPLIQRLELLSGGNVESTAELRKLRHSLSTLIDDHTQEGDRFETIAELSNSYNPPADACNTYRLTFEKLQAFEKDLHIHVHLENNLLFRKAEQMLVELN